MRLQAQIMASVAEIENWRKKRRANRAIISRFGASAEAMTADYKNRKCKPQQQLKRLESKHKNVVSALEAENANHRWIAQELKSKSNENESWREKVSTLNSNLQVLDKRESEVAVEQKTVAVRRRQVCVLLIGLSPLTMLSLLFGSVVPQGGGSRSLRKTGQFETACMS